MILGMSTYAFTLLHTAISLIGILAGPFVLWSFISGAQREGWTMVFLVFTILTSVTGFFFPFTTFAPPQIIGVLSLIVLAVALIAYYVFHLAGAWRWIYVVSMVVAFYLNFFVLIAQLFDKIPPLKALAPTASEPPFTIAQIVVLLAFVYLGFRSVKRYHPMIPAS